MTSDEMLSWIDRVSAGIAQSKRVRKPEVKFWDKRRAPLRYKWAKLPPVVRESHTG